MFDRVKQETTTTGTGSYTISGAAPAGYRTFAEAATAFASKYTTTDVPCCYLATFLDEWEIGWGVLNAAGTTLTRSTVINSSDGPGTAVTWAAGTKAISMVPLTFGYAGHGFRHEYQGGTNYPNGDDDITQGYGRGSTWLNSTGKKWVCIDETEGAAVWVRVAPGIVSPNQPAWPGSPESTQFGGSMLKTDGGEDPSPRTDHSLMLSDVNSANAYHTHGGTIAGRVRTTSAAAGQGLLLLGSPTGGIAGKGIAVAYNETDDAVASWEFTFTAKSASGVLTLVGTPAVAPIDTDGAMATADFDVVISGDDILLNTVGIAAKNITWSINLQAVEVYSA